MTAAFAVPPVVVPARYELVKRTAKGAEFVAAVQSGLYKYLAIGGAIGGVKSFTTISTLIALCRIFPGSRWAIVRNDLPTLKRNTIPTIEKMRPPTFMGDLNRSSWTYTCANGSQLLLFPESIDRDPDLGRWKGLEVNGFLLEEANELAEKSHFKAIERAGRWIIPTTPLNPSPRQPPPLILYTFNPADTWVKPTFWEPYTAGTLQPPWFYLPTSIKDNPFLPQDYLDSLENLPDPEYRRFVLGDWNVTVHPRQLIHSDWLKAAENADLVPGPARFGIDVARYGDDLTVGYIVHGNVLSPEQATKPALEYQGIDTAETGRRAAIVAQEHAIAGDQIRVDVVGLGGGTADTLRRMRFRHVREIIAGGRAIQRPKADPNYTSYRYGSIRAQMWWEFREKVRTGRFRLPWPLPKRLFEDLTAPHYDMDGDTVIEVETKKEIEDRIGRSTDHGDALVMAAFDLPKLNTSTMVGRTRHTVSAR